LWWVNVAHEPETPEAVRSAVDEIAQERQTAPGRRLVCHGLEEAVELFPAAMNIADRELIWTIESNRRFDPVRDCGGRAHDGLLWMICLREAGRVSKELVRAVRDLSRFGLSCCRQPPERRLWPSFFEASSWFGSGMP
jgi:hypothetical protein